MKRTTSLQQVYFNFTTSIQQVYNKCKTSAQTDMESGTKITQIGFLIMNFIQKLLVNYGPFC